ncbi:MAG: prepilin-type N-terminal cleavage/methylation domain-containing protein [Planctomycetes bacterium]|nr:prepilin-type N-terminal cleavage/methylation domain-containing protein [Planctomycetota bacterium]
MNTTQPDRGETRTSLGQAERRESQPAFTLVELLVVVSIIALLISILLPSLRKAREQAKAVKCLGHMRGMGQVAIVFANDHDSRVQLAASAGNVKAADSGRQRYAYGFGGELLSWPVALAQVTATGYTNNWDWGVRASKYEEAKAAVEFVDQGLDMFTCPGDFVTLSSAFFPRHQTMYGEGLVGDGDPKNPRSPAEKMSYWGRLSYGINEDIAGGDGADIDFWPSCWRAVEAHEGGWKECYGGIKDGPQSECFRSSTGHRLRGELDKVFGPSEVGLFFETGPESEDQAMSLMYGDQYANLVNSTALSSALKTLSGPYLGDAQQSHPWRIPTNRHPDGRINVTFADGHGEAVRAVGHAYNGDVKRMLPNEYAPRVRVSPYNPHGLGAY